MRRTPLGWRPALVAAACLPLLLTGTTALASAPADDGGSYGVTPNDYVLGPAAATGGVYSQIRNKYKSDAGRGNCLHTSGGTDAVAVGGCTPAAGESAATRRWKTVDAGNGYFYLENERRADEGKGQCLRTSSGTDAVTVGGCHASAGEYTSMRLWKVVGAGSGYYRLENKFKSDAGKGRCLRTSSADDHARAGDCTPGSGEFSSMRMWASDGFGDWPSRPVTGHRKALLMATHWTGVKPVDPQPVRQAVFGEQPLSLRTYLAEVSGGKLDLTGTVLEDVDLGPAPASGQCPHKDMLGAARAKAKERGVDPAGFDYLFVDISAHSGCAWAGLASMPGNWIISNGNGHKSWMWTHEFGHNLGLRHSDTLLSCPHTGDTVRIDASCAKKGSNDPTDTMGNGGKKLYPVDYRQWAGWLSASRTGPNVKMLQSSGSYHLNVLGKGGVQEYRILRSDGTYLSLEVRQPDPPYDDFPADSPFAHGLIVRIVSMGGTVTNTLVDATPATVTTKDAPLPVGKTLVDEVGNAAVRLCSVGAQGADLRIAVNGHQPGAC